VGPTESAKIHRFVLFGHRKSKRKEMALGGRGVGRHVTVKGDTAVLSTVVRRRKKDTQADKRNIPPIFGFMQKERHKVKTEPGSSLMGERQKLPRYGGRKLVL